MPIRETERERYPKNWRAISKAIRDRAGQRCECTGQCGSTHEALYGARCGAPNGALVIRDPKDPAQWELHDGCTGCVGGDDDHPKVVKVVLTVAHLDHTPENCEPANLLALCQRCHLRMDAEHHQHNALETRRKHKAAGELPGL